MAKRINRRKDRAAISKIILIIFVVLFIAAAARSIKRLPKKEAEILPTPASEQAEKRINISGISVKDFMSEVENAENEVFVTITRTKDYHVFYIPSQEVFFISIVSWPFDEHRLVAEADFLDKLGISGEDACKLRVDETTPSFANPDKAGKAYPMSFCPE